MKKVKGIVFDLDGTLVDSAQMVFASINYAIEPWQIKLDFLGIEKIRTKIGDTLFEEILPDREAEKVAYERLKKFTLENTHMVEVFDGVEEILIEAKRKELVLALWTGRDTESAKLILKLNNLDHYFSTIVGNSCVRINKPNTEGMSLISKRISIMPSELVMIGDHEHDVIGGKDAGAFTVRALWARNELREGAISSDMIFYTVKDLHEWIRLL